MSQLSPARLLAVANALGVDAALFDGKEATVLRIEAATLIIQFFSDEDEQVLVLAAELGIVGPKARARIYPSLLAANASWRSVAGGALTLDEARHMAMLILRLDLAALDDAALAQRLYAFTHAALEWTAWLAAGVQAMAFERGREIDIAPVDFA